MNDIKKQILKEIQDRIDKKQELKKQAQSNGTYEAKVMDFFKEVEDFSQLDKSYFDPLVEIARDSLQKTIRSIYDPYVRVAVSIRDMEDGKKCVDTVTIFWSTYYQQKFNVEPQITLDAITLMMEKK